MPVYISSEIKTLYKTKRIVYNKIKEFNMHFNKSILLAISAAVCYGISAPISKILLNNISPVFMASLLYLGAGSGMALVVLIKNSKNKIQTEANLGIKDLPYIVGMVVLDIVAPMFLMFGLVLTTSANVSLLNNFEIVATSMIALIIFKETVGKRMWIAIILITFSTIILSFEDISSLSFSFGSFLVLGACISWGFENNCTRMLSLKNPLEIVVLKGFGSGIGSLIISIITKTYSTDALYIGLTLLLGFFAYGLSIYFYIIGGITDKRILRFCSLYRCYFIICIFWANIKYTIYCGFNNNGIRYIFCGQ
jgi:drug/metabolite transporter (DMT)-like permease